MRFAFEFLDIAVVLVVLASAIYATYRGLVSESLAIFGWVAAAYATLYFGPYCASWMRSVISPQWLGEVAGYGVVFLVVLIPLHFAASRIAVNVKRSQVGTIDSVLGTGFGILRGVAIVGIAYLLFTAAVPVRSQPEWVAGARLLPVIRASAEVVASLIPDQNVRVEGVHKAAEQPQPSDVSDLPPDMQAKSGVKAAEKAQNVPEPEEKPEAPVSKPVPKPTHSKAVKGEKPSPAKHVKKTYGVDDRHALDKLIETTDTKASGKP